VQFNRDIRPILSDNCFQCHGPDKAKRKARLHLDTEEGAFARRDGPALLVPGKPAQSELWRRISTTDPKERMPLASSGRTLSPRQIELIRRWIEQGAKWQKHWSFLPPERPPLPAVRETRWPRNPIDYFVLERLEREGLAPSAEADKTTLLRRVTLDLTGLPPTPAEVDAFLADPGPDAYEKVVDRLLQSPRFGERMAIRWLDAARYADTNGYQNDGERFMWRWRDWVIDAYNHNMPFDRFTIEQLAGDLLPHPTLDQRIATGFNRNHRGNAEGGIIPEEYAVEYVVDRVETTATVWLGLTMGCARCHDHKFDPLRQKEFYQVFAFFNNVPERGKAIKYGNSPPMLKAPTRAQQEELGALDRRLAFAEARFEQLQPALAAAQAAWERSATAHVRADWTPPTGLVAHFPLDGARGGRQPPVPTNDAHQAPGSPRFRDGSACFVPGKLGQAASFDGKRYLDAGNVGDFTFYDKFSLSAWIYPTDARGGAILSRMTDAANADGYSLMLENGRLHVNLVKRWLDDSLRVETQRSLPLNRWYHVLVTYDGSRVMDGVKVYVDGKPEKLNALLDDLNQDFKTTEPFRIGAGGGPESRFHGAIDDVRIYQIVLSPAQAELLATTDPIDRIVATPPDKRTPEQAHKLHGYFLEHFAPEPVRQAHGQVAALRKEREQLVESFTTTMVMEELPTPRDAYVLIRGVYDKHGEKVSAGVPASLPPLPRGVKPNRLGFAQWLTDPSNPLTARVSVNRFWQMLFGAGLVKTMGDFGSQGEWPTHPELLDWLATEFIRTGWDMKAMLKTIVLSATYRQSSHVTAELERKDPENQLLARGPRFRLSAEMVRDQALAVGGLLVERLGGPSVRPYQPAGLWKELADAVYTQDKGPSLYRRSLYTFWKRTVAPPEMITFDAAGREACSVQQARTNTPLQALTLMNDVTFVEAARALAQRIVLEGGASPQERLTLAFRLAVARRPTPAELNILVGDFRHQWDVFRKDRAAALQLLRTGEFHHSDRLDAAELAAYTAVAGLILNLDEVITKE
jgi:hypothetical protein